MQAIDANAVGIGKSRPFEESPLGPGYDRIVGQECDEIDATNEDEVSLGQSKMDRSQLVAFYEMENKIK